MSYTCKPDFCVYRARNRTMNERDYYVVGEVGDKLR